MISVYDQSREELVGEQTKKVGIRQVIIDQSPFEGGKHFKITVNGNRVFAKGGDFIPVDMIYSQITRQKYEKVINLAIENNFNAFRVWGGGLYESDDFYDLCDEKGLIVWQDFIAACATYPSFDPEFLKNYIKEIKYNIRRMAHFASIVLYCGNNEIEMLMGAGTENVDRLANFTDASLYYVILPRVLYEEGEERYYHPSSPYSAPGVPPKSYLMGNQHLWGFFYHMFRFRDVACTFPNEGGLLGPTSLPCTVACLGDGQQYLHSFDYKLHDNCECDRSRWTPELHAVEQYLGIPFQKYQHSIPDSIYYLGFVHGEGLYEYLINFRRRMSDFTSAAIFWMFNACWPEVRSWGTVDYLGNRTPAFWSVKRALSPIAAEFAEEEICYSIYGINDRLTDKKGKLTYGYMLPCGDIKLQTVNVTLSANGARVIARLEKADLPEGAIPLLELEIDGEPLFRRRWINREHKLIGLEKTDILVTKHANGSATYFSKKPVFGVCLDLDGDDGTLSDNFFDLYPNRPYTVDLGSKNGDVLYAYMGI